VPLTDAALAELLTLWPTLPAAVRRDLLALARAQAHAD
jgi:hypothetical protein